MNLISLIIFLEFLLDRKAMKNLPVLLGLLVLSATLAGCQSDLDAAVEEDGPQGKVGLVLYNSLGEKISEIEQCSYPDYLSTPEDVLIAKTILPSPEHGTNDGEPLYIEPTDFQNNFVIFNGNADYFENKNSGSQDLSHFTVFDHAEELNASVIIASYSVDSNGVELTTCTDLEDRQNFLHRTAAYSINIPVIWIKPTDMEIVRTTPDRIMGVGPEGSAFPESIDLASLESDNRLEGLYVESKSVWEEGHEDCLQDDGAGGLIITTKRDTNQDGNYSNDEIEILVECRPFSPYQGTLNGVSTQEEDRPNPSCISGIESRERSTYYYTNNTSSTETGSYRCTGISIDDLQNMIEQEFCGGQEAVRESSGELSIYECISSNLEETIHASMPKIDVEQVSSEQLPKCGNGGIKIVIWIDSNGDTGRNSSEIISTNAICNGNDGINGVDGNDGKDGYNPLIEVSTNIGEECGQDVSGKEILTGRDVNRNGQLDENEVEDFLIICDGQDGEDGVSTIIENVSSTEMEGCEGLYIRLTHGLDADNNLDLGINETIGFKEVCIPNSPKSSNSTLITEKIIPNAACQNGGVRTYLWIDLNNNSKLEDSMEYTEIFMEEVSCNPFSEPEECEEADSDCLTDESDESEQNDRDSYPDEDDDGVPDHLDQCPDGDDSIDEDGDDIPDCRTTWW